MLLNFQTYYLRLYRHATKENFEMNDGKLRMILILILTLSYNAGQFFQNPVQVVRKTSLNLLNPGSTACGINSVNERTTPAKQEVLTLVFDLFPI